MTTQDFISKLDAIYRSERANFQCFFNVLCDQLEAQLTTRSAACLRPFLMNP